MSMRDDWRRFKYDYVMARRDVVGSRRCGFFGVPRGRGPRGHVASVLTALHGWVHYGPLHGYRRQWLQDAERWFADREEYLRFQIWRWRVLHLGHQGSFVGSMWWEDRRRNRRSS